MKIISPTLDSSTFRVRNKQFCQMAIFIVLFQKHLIFSLFKFKILAKWRCSGLLVRNMWFFHFSSSKQKWPLSPRQAPNRKFPTEPLIEPKKGPYRSGWSHLKRPERISDSNQSAHYGTCPRAPKPTISISGDTRTQKNKKTPQSVSKYLYKFQDLWNLKCWPFSKRQTPTIPDDPSNRKL